MESVLIHISLFCFNCLKESTFLTELSKLIHVLLAEGIKESVLRDNLQLGIIISLPFLNGYTVVHCLVVESVYRDNQGQFDLLYCKRVFFCFF